MRHTAFGLVVALAIVLSATRSLAQEEGEQKIDWYDDVGIYLVHDVERHFDDARAAFLDGKAAASAENIRQGAALLMVEAERARDKETKTLMASARELRGLADNVEKGNVASVERLDKAFSHAHYALAKSHYAYGVKAWEAKDVDTAAQAFKVAAIHLQRAVIWPGYERKEYVDKVVEDINLLSGKLLGGTGWVAEEAEKVIAALGEEIDEIGKKVEPAKQ